MDLNEVIAELRSELETLDRVVDSLEKLAQIRTANRVDGLAGSTLTALARRRSRKESADLAKVAAASS